MYRRFFKRFFDILLSSLAIILIAIPMLIIAIAIKIDDHGPVFFKQRRVGAKKNGKITYFTILKFRSMKTSAPSDIPTHMFEKPEDHITRVGAFIRQASLDELPQILQVFVGTLSLVGPRPALWSQDDLVAEREKYGVNDLKPGITGWAQINGRDELEIPIKAKFDGEYAAALNAGGMRAFAMDVKCLFGTVGSVLFRRGFVEGGTGRMNEEKETEDAKKK